MAAGGVEGRRRVGGSAGGDVAPHHEGRPEPLAARRRQVADRAVQRVEGAVVLGHVDVRFGDESGDPLVDEVADGADRTAVAVRTTDQGAGHRVEQAIGRVAALEQCKQVRLGAESNDLRRPTTD